MIKILVFEMVGMSYRIEKHNLRIIVSEKYLFRNSLEFSPHELQVIWMQSLHSCK